jgi:hypothetical protein
VAERFLGKKEVLSPILSQGSNLLQSSNTTHINKSYFQRMAKEQGQPTEFEQLYPWLSRNEWLAEIERPDTANVLNFSRVLISLIPGEFKNGASLYVEGGAAVPGQLVEKEAPDIDLRLVFPGEHAPQNSREFEDLHNRIRGKYNTGRGFANIRAILGNMEVRISDEYGGSVYDHLKPIRGRPINLRLPLEWKYGVNASIDDFKDYHRENLHFLGFEIDALRRNLGESNPEYEKRRLELLAEAYIVRVYPA